MYLVVQCWTVTLLVSSVVANQQAWSEQTALNTPHSFFCNDTIGNMSVSIADNLTWTKLGSDTDLESDELYQLLNDSGVTNMGLQIRMVTPDMAGIYFCIIRNKTGEQVGRVVKGLNIAGHLYNDKFDEYRSKVITGVVSGVSVFTIVVGICLIDRFKYLTGEQKEKRRDRKQDRLRRLHPSQNGGVDNPAMQDGVYNAEKHNSSLNEAVYGNTHL